MILALNTSPLNVITNHMLIRPKPSPWPDGLLAALFANRLIGGLLLHNSTSYSVCMLQLECGTIFVTKIGES